MQCSFKTLKCGLHALELPAVNIASTNFSIFDLVIFVRCSIVMMTEGASKCTLHFFRYRLL